MDEWYYALDSLKAIGALGLTIGGFLALLGGVFGRPRTNGGAADPDPAQTTEESAGDEFAASAQAVSEERLRS